MPKHTLVSKYVCGKCGMYFANRQNKYRHEKSGAKCEVRIEQSGGSALPTDTEAGRLNDKRYEELKEELAEIKLSMKSKVESPNALDVTVNINVTLNVFGRGSGSKVYPSFNEVEGMRDTLCRCVSTSNLVGLLRYLHFNDEYPENKTIRNLKNDTIEVYASIGNGWMTKKGDEVMDEVTDIFGDIFCGFLSSIAEKDDDDTLPCNEGHIGVFYRNIVKPLDWELDANVIERFKLVEWKRTTAQRVKIYENLKRKVYETLYGFLQDERHVAIDPQSQCTL
jgi:hypothetical protein